MDGYGVHFNFILSNGMRTRGRDNTLYTEHMLPDNMKTTKVQIHYIGSYISGFKFFSSDFLFFEIGNTNPNTTVIEVLLLNNEQIIGVVFKSHPVWQTLYSDF